MSRLRSRDRSTLIAAMVNAITKLVCVCGAVVTADVRGTKYAIPSPVHVKHSMQTETSVRAAMIMTTAIPDWSVVVHPTSESSASAPMNATTMVTAQTTPSAVMSSAFRSVSRTLCLVSKVPLCTALLKHRSS